MGIDIKAKTTGFFKNFRFGDHSTGMAFILLFILAVIVGWPNFLQPRNLINILRQISYTGIIGLGMTLIIIAIFPSTSTLKNLPRLSEWYLYVGAFLGIAIMVAPIFLIPRIGATSTSDSYYDRCGC